VSWVRIPPGPPDRLHGQRLANRTPRGAERCCVHAPFDRHLARGSVRTRRPSSPPAALPPMIEDAPDAFITILAAAAVGLLAASLIVLAVALVGLMRAHPLERVRRLPAGMRGSLPAVKFPRRRGTLPSARAMDRGIKWPELAGTIGSLAALLLVVPALEGLMASRAVQLVDGPASQRTIQAAARGPSAAIDRVGDDASSPTPSASTASESPTHLAGAAPPEPIVAVTSTPSPRVAAPLPGPTGRPGDPGPQPTGTVAPAPTATPPPSPSPAPTPRSTPTPSPTPRPDPTPTPTPTPSPTPTPPPREERPEILSWTVSPRRGDRPLHVVFEATWRGADQWALEFGDGRSIDGSGHSLTRPHTYAHADTYIATLEITGPGGSESVRVEIVVSD
jgi:hypothetical protein